MINQFLQLWQTASQSEKKEIANFVAKEMQPKATETASEVIEYLNFALDKPKGRGFRPTETNKRLVRARLAEGYSLDEIKAVIDRKIAESRQGRFDPFYLRPATLFNAEKFNNYVGQIDDKMPEPPKPKLKRPPESDNAAWISLAKKVGAHNTATYDQIWNMATVAYDNGRLEL